MLARAEEIARKENRTVSELVADALRQYERTRWWDSMNSFGRALAEERGLTEADVVSAVKDVRRRRAQKSQLDRLRAREPLVHGYGIQYAEDYEQCKRDRGGCS